MRRDADQASTRRRTAGIGQGICLWRAELGKQSVDGKASQQNRRDQEADRFGCLQGSQSALVLDALFADLDSPGDLESALRTSEREVPIRHVGQAWNRNFAAHHTSRF
jgi:hypothetical protein